jgi:lysophospholipase L1-like esterase
MTDDRETTDPDVLTAAQEDELLRGAPWHRLAVLGDSLAEAALADPVAGYERVSWPERVARALRRQQGDLELLNVAKRDLTSAQVAAAQVEPALDFRPDLAFVLCGGNDILGREFDREQTRATIDSILTAFTGAGSDVLLITTFDTGPLPVPEPFRTRLVERMPVLHELYRELGSDPRITLADLAKSPRGRDRGIFSADGMHTNDAGQAVISSLVITALTHAIPHPTPDHPA